MGKMKKRTKNDKRSYCPLYSPRSYICMLAGRGEECHFGCFDRAESFYTPPSDWIRARETNKQSFLCLLYSSPLFQKKSMQPSWLAVSFPFYFFGFFTFNILFACAVTKRGIRKESDSCSFEFEFYFSQKKEKKKHFQRKNVETKNLINFFSTNPPHRNL